MKKESSTNLQKYLEMETNQTELVQLIRQLKDYVIIDRKDYESIVRNSTPGGCNESALEAREAHIKLLDTQLAQQTEWTKYWKNKYEKCLEELKKKEELNKKTDKWWKF